MPTPLNQKPAMAAWIVRERKRLRLKPRDLVERLSAQGLIVSEGTVKVWESNADRRPAPENVEGLERIFESSAPSRGAPSNDQSVLLASMERQTAAIEAQVVAINALVGTLTPLVAEQGEAVRSNSELLARLLEQVLQADARLSALERTAG